MTWKDCLARSEASTKELQRLIDKAHTSSEQESEMVKGTSLEEQYLHHTYQRARNAGSTHADALAGLDDDNTIAECADAAAAIRKAAARAIDPDVVKPTTSKELLRRTMPITALQPLTSHPFIDRVTVLAKLQTAQAEAQRLRKIADQARARGEAAEEAESAADEAEETVRKLRA